MEISNNGLMLPNDEVQVTGTMVYGGALVVTNIGPTALAVGNQFFLFNAGASAGAFSSIILPPLGPGRGWTNRLSVDGSIQVIATSVPQFSSISRSGTNLLFSGSGGPGNGTYEVVTSTNVTIPLSNWAALLTNQFDSSGNFVF